MTLFYFLQGDPINSLLALKMFRFWFDWIDYFIYDLNDLVDHDWLDNVYRTPRFGPILFYGSGYDAHLQCNML